MRKLSVLALLVVSAMVFTGCSKGEPAADMTPPKNADTATPSAAAPGGPAPTGGQGGGNPTAAAPSSE